MIGSQQILVLALFLAVSLCETPPFGVGYPPATISDGIQLPSPVYFKMNDNKYSIEHKIVDTKISGQAAKGHFFSIAGPNENFEYYMPDRGCGHREVTSDTAKTNNCSVATNAGFFNMITGSCIGNVVIEGKIVQTSSEVRANFGYDGNANFAAGYFDPNDVKKGNFVTLVAGVGWLVRNGVNYLNESVAVEKVNPSFVTEIAPRLCIGHDKEGKLLILEVDGFESKKEGVSLTMLTELALQYGFINAINLDGGGSTTVCIDGKVVNKPGNTGNVQRAVTTITCLK